MADSIITVGNVKWPNQFQNPTGITASVSPDYLSPQSIEARNMPDANSKQLYDAKRPDVIPSTSAKGRVIDTYA